MSGRLVAAITITPSVGLETVHLDEHLVQRLLALVIATAETGTAMAPDCVDFIDEDDAGRALLGLLEHVADAAAPTPTNISTKSEPEIEKNGTLASPAMALASSVLAGARRADQQHAARDASAQLLELLRVFQEVDELLDLLLGLVASS